MSADAGKLGLLKKSMYGTQALQAIVSVFGKDTSKKSMSKAGAFNLGSARRTCFTRKVIRNDTR